MEQTSLFPADPSWRTAPPIFRTAWYATGLGEYRPCRYTYQAYAYEEQAPLDVREFTGDYTWLGEPGTVDPGSDARLAGLDAQLTEVGLALPADFVTFYRHDNLRYALDEASVTCCWTDLGQRPIPSPVEPGSYLVRFFRDQQDCAIWYLYLRPGGETCVVFSHVDFEEETPEELAEWPAADTEIRWCSATFEQFAYRCWLENHIWRRLHAKPPQPLDPAMSDYLHHYRRDEPTPPSPPARRPDTQSDLA